MDPLTVLALHMQYSTTETILLFGLFGVAAASAGIAKAGRSVGGAFKAIGRVAKKAVGKGN